MAAVPASTSASEGSMCNTVAYLASVASSVTIVFALLSLGFLFQDMNAFYNTSLDEFGEFTVTRLALISDL